MPKVLLAFSLCISLVTVGCTTATYTPPLHVDEKEQYSITINRKYDQVWKELITYSAGTFFSIDNFEKDSGLLTLSFGASNPWEYITGGHWKSVGEYAYDGDYVEYLARHNQGQLQGKMNIVVSKVDENVTNVTVHSRYIFHTNPETWSFDTGNCGTIIVQNKALGTGTSSRTICPTYKAERTVINGIK